MGLALPTSSTSSPTDDLRCIDALPLSVRPRIDCARVMTRAQSAQHPHPITSVSGAFKLVVDELVIGFHGQQQVQNHPNHASNHKAVGQDEHHGLLQRLDPGAHVGGAGPEVGGGPAGDHAHAHAKREHAGGDKAVAAGERLRHEDLSRMQQMLGGENVPAVHTYPYARRDDIGKKKRGGTPQHAVRDAQDPGPKLGDDASKQQPHARGIASIAAGAARDGNDAVVLRKRGDLCACEIAVPAVSQHLPARRPTGQPPWSTGHRSAAHRGHAWGGMSIHLHAVPSYRSC